MTSHMLSAPINFAQSVMPRLHVGDDDFFKDILPSSMEEGKDKLKHKMKENMPTSMEEGKDELKHKMKEKMPSSVEEGKETVKEKMKEATHKMEGGESKQQSQTFSDQSYSSYSYSSSTIVDEDGHLVTSMRRRYEDSAGRLKAVHERQIDDMKVKSVWQKKDKQDRGKHKTICQSTDVDEFEKDWQQTPFGKAEAGQQESIASMDPKPQGVQDAEKQSESITPGPDFEAAERAPDKVCGEEAEGVTKESHERSRDEAIAQGSKRQEEETTPREYTSTSGERGASGKPRYS